MDIEECISKIVSDGNIEEMHKLSDMLEDVMEIVQEHDEHLYKKYKMKLYEMAYGKVLSRDFAEELVRNMKPYRMRWSFEDTREIQSQYGINDIDEIDFFVVINSAYNDYRDVLGESIENYVKFTIDFIKDEDAKDGKVFTYFTTIPE